MRRARFGQGVAVIGSVLTLFCADAGGARAQGTTASGVSAGDQSQSVSAPVGPLVVTMAASPALASVGQSVTYTAQVSGVPPGKQVLYHWAFEGGTGVGPQITRSYPDPGDYPVAVTVTVSSVAGLSGAADTVTVVAAPSKPSSVPGVSAAGAGGSGTGRSGNGAGSGKPGARHVAGRSKAPAGVANPLATQAPSAQGGQQVQGLLLTDAGLPFAPPSAATSASASGSSGGAGSGSAVAGGAAGVGGALALTIAIVTLGALDERRRISLRNS